MARPIRAKAFSVAVLTALFFGSMAYLVQVDAQTESAPSSWTIPVSRFGDHVEYDVRWQGLDTWMSATPFAFERRMSWDVTGPHEVLDQAWNPRPSVLIERKIVASTEGAACPCMPDRLYIEPQTRDLVQHRDGAMGRHDFLRNLRVVRNEVPPTLPTDYQFHGIQFGPDFDADAWDSWIRWDDRWTTILIQGMTLEVGDDLSDLVRDQRNGNTYGTRTHSLRAAESATIAGTPVIGLRLEEDSWKRIYQWRLNETTRQDLWFSADAPYPLRIDTAYEWDWKNVATGETIIERATWSLNLVEYEAGGSVVPWGETFTPLRTEITRELQWQHGPHPRSGAGWRGTFHLEQAVASVESDLTLREFNVWKQANPGYQLIGFWYEDGGDRDATRSGMSWWTLTFARPLAATGFRVTSQRLDAGIISNSESSRPVNLPVQQRMDPATWPTKFPTFGALDELWKDVADPEAFGKGPRRIAWGARPGTWTNYTPFSILYGYYETDFGSNPPGKELQNAILFDVAEAKVGQAFAWLDVPNPQAGAAQPLAPLAPVERQSSTPSRHSSNLLPLVAATGTTVSLLVLLGAYVFPFLQQGIVSLYSKLVKHQLLDNKVRDQLVNLIQLEPGITAPELKSAIGGGWSTIIYHLDVLKRNHLITTHREGRHRRYYPVGTIPNGRLREIGALRNDRTRQILGLIETEPGIDKNQLARRIGVTPAAAYWHLKRLLQVGLVVAQKRGRAVGYLRSTQNAEAGRQASRVAVASG